MGQFVYHDVVDQRGLEHHGPPVEAQGAVGGAAPPPLALVADQHPGHRTPAQSGLPAGHAGWQPLLGPTPVPRHHRPPNPLSSLAAIASAVHTAIASVEAVAYTAIAAASACVIHTANAVHTAADAEAVTQAGRHEDAEAPVVEADLRRTGTANRRLDDQADVAPQVGQRLAADEPPGRQGWARNRADCSRGPTEAATGNQPGPTASRPTGPAGLGQASQHPGRPFGHDGPDLTSRRH